MQFMNQMGGINLVVYVLLFQPIHNNNNNTSDVFGYYIPTVLHKDVGLSHQVSVLLGPV